MRDFGTQAYKANSVYDKIFIRSGVAFANCARFDMSAAVDTVLRARAAAALAAANAAAITGAGRPPPTKRLRRTGDAPSVQDVFKQAVRLSDHVPVTVDL